MKRKVGFYFIYWFDSWSIAYYKENGSWCVLASEEEFSDNDFDKIDERIIEHKG